MDNSEKLPRLLSLCSGYGGLERGVERAIGKCVVLAYVEVEAFAVANLVDKMENNQLVPAPVWTDIKTFNAKIFRGMVDILCGGYPCQPFSAAGKRKGIEDPRHLWPHIKKIIKECRPKICFFENVEGHISLGLEEVLSDLGELGYRVETGIFSAAEVGAPHQRKRIFILGHSVESRLEGWKRRILQECCDEQAFRSGSASMADSQSTKRQQSGNSWSRRSGFADSNRWPARPGQPQFDWEESRTI